MKFSRLLLIAISCHTFLPAIATLRHANGLLRSSQERKDDDADDMPLPMWATDIELKQEQTDFFSHGASQTINFTAAVPSNFRMPAEFEPISAVIMAWSGYAEEIIHQTAKEVSAAGAEVWIIDGPETLEGVPQELYLNLEFKRDSMWARDYGPIGVSGGGLSIIDTRYRHYLYREFDDAIPCQVANHTGALCHTTSLILDGGNVMTDGNGTLFMTSMTYDWNSEHNKSEVDEALQTMFGVDTIHVLDYAKTSSGHPADGTGHIDMFAKILAQCIVAVAETSDDPFREIVEAAATYFAELDCLPGQKYKVSRIPGWVASGNWHTYTNSLIVNDRVVVPGYERGMDDLAKEIYEQSANYTVAIVNSDKAIRLGGAIHCLTSHVPAIE